MEIKISRCHKTCAASERDFVHEDEIVSLVRIAEGELQREDYLKEFWQEEFGKNAYSVWSHQYYDPKVEEEDTEEFSPLRALFYEAIDSEDRVTQAVAFLAAQLLRRQKVFRKVKEVEEADDGLRLVLYSDRVGGRLLEVRDPSFGYPELEAARTGLMNRLQELEAPEPEADEHASDEPEQDDPAEPQDTAASEEEVAPVGSTAT